MSFSFIFCAVASVEVVPIVAVLEGGEGDVCEDVEGGMPRIQVGGPGKARTTVKSAVPGSVVLPTLDRAPPTNPVQPRAWHPKNCTLSGMST